jgi:hypothetical protein
LARLSRAFSPWGYSLPKSVARIWIYLAPNRTRCHANITAKYGPWKVPRNSGGASRET